MPEKGVVHLVGAQFRFDMVHKTNTLSKDDEGANIIPIPYSVNTGTFTVTKENMEAFLANREKVLDLPMAMRKN
jgi:hypothetical protein